MMFVFAGTAAAQGGADWQFRLAGGVAFPAGAATGAPALSASFTAGLRAMVVPRAFPVPLTVEVEGVHWLTPSRPDRTAVPLDEGLYVKRALHFPLLVGVRMPLGSGQWRYGVGLSAGAYWRNLTLQRMAAPGVMDDMEESGWGMAWKVDAEMLWRMRLSLAVSYLAFGNPFGNCGDVPYGTGAVVDGVRRSQPSMTGYGQGFLTLSLGYHLQVK